MVARTGFSEGYTVIFYDLRRFVRLSISTESTRVPTHPLTPIDLFQPSRRGGGAELPNGLPSRLRHDQGGIESRFHLLFLFFLVLVTSQLEERTSIDLF